ncbi:MAG: hypothetical protein HQ572_05245 [Candidatus Omnitrophica bacterium]|nr:hypothetical protein [Candidatus Omnitrophota bacterium]
MRKTVLVVGDLMMNDEKFEPSLNRFITYKHRLNNRNIGVLFITYDDLAAKRLPNVSTKRLDVMLFFPYNHWNEEIERYDRDERIYGDLNFGEDFKKFFLMVNSTIKRKYRYHDLRFINPPTSCIIDRDKEKTYQALKRAGIRSPIIYRVKSASDVKGLIGKGISLYAKPRFGAMGKGITYINQRGCYTNFIFRKNRIHNRLHDYNWKAVKISQKNQSQFLKTLIDKGFIFQEAIYTPVVRGRKFDMRIYCIYNRVPYMYAKSTQAKNFITNWSQGGRIEKKKSFLKRAIGDKAIREAILLAKKSARALKLNYAGVDVIFDRKRRELYVLEIQSFPGYERGFKLMKFLADNI